MVQANSNSCRGDISRFGTEYESLAAVYNTVYHKVIYLVNRKVGE
jgi:hypothetical protein